jgi:hypothetical protein
MKFIQLFLQTFECFDIQFPYFSFKSVVEQQNIKYIL